VVKVFFSHDTLATQLRVQISQFTLEFFSMRLTRYLTNAQG